MAYVPNNLALYISSYAGAMAGMGASGRIVNSALVAAYAGLGRIAGAWAAALDTAWGVTPATTLDIENARTASYAVWSERSPPAGGIYVLASTYASECAALVAMMNAADLYFTGQGISPDAGGGGGGFPAPVTITVSPFAVPSTGGLFLIDTSGGGPGGGTPVANLPDNPAAGTTVSFRQWPFAGAGAGTLTVNPFAGGAIDGNATKVGDTNAFAFSIVHLGANQWETQVTGALSMSKNGIVGSTFLAEWLQVDGPDVQCSIGTGADVQGILYCGPVRTAVNNINTPLVLVNAKNWLVLADPGTIPVTVRLPPDPYEMQEITVSDFLGVCGAGNEITLDAVGNVINANPTLVLNTPLVSVTVRWLNFQWLIISRGP